MEGYDAMCTLTHLMKLENLSPQLPPRLEGDKVSGHFPGCVILHNPHDRLDNYRNDSENEPNPKEPENRDR